MWWIWILGSVLVIVFVMTWLLTNAILHPVTHSPEETLAYEIEQGRIVTGRERSLAWAKTQPPTTTWLMLIMFPL